MVSRTFFSVFVILTTSYLVYQLQLRLQKKLENSIFVYMSKCSEMVINNNDHFYKKKKSSGKRDLPFSFPCQLINLTVAESRQNYKTLFFFKLNYVSKLCCNLPHFFLHFLCFLNLSVNLFVFSFNKVQ